MAEAFTRAAVYLAEGCCQTPLRTGGVDGDPEQILRDRNGIAFLQGTSLAGALRDWLASGPDRKWTEALFGSQSGGGHLIVSDAVFDETAKEYIRPRLRIDSATASGAIDEQARGGKFDMAHIGTNATLRFSLTWLGMPSDMEQELSAIERTLSALNAGEIHLGAQKTNGFGKVRLSVKKRVFDLTDAEDRTCWLSNDWEGSPLALPKVERRREVRFTVRGRAENLLIKSAPVQEQTPGGLRSYTPNLEEDGRALVPGSSIKGPIRARAVYIAKRLDLEESFVKESFGCASENDRHGKPGQIRFEDAVLSNQKKRISRVHIDYLTGGVFRGGLFTEEAVCSDITLSITAPYEPALCGLLLYALRDLGLGLYSLGSGWAIGRGQIAVQSIQAEAPDGKCSVLERNPQGGMTQNDPSGLFREWLEKLEAKRHEN